MWPITGGGSDHMACPTNSESLTGATMLTNCSCYPGTTTTNPGGTQYQAILLKIGYYLSLSDGECIVCPAGSYCNANMKYECSTIDSHLTISLPGSSMAINCSCQSGTVCVIISSLTNGGDGIVMIAFSTTSTSN